MAMFQVLPKVIGAEELLRLVALAEFVDVIEVFPSSVPVSGIGEFLSTVPAEVYSRLYKAGRVVRWMKRGLDSSQSGARPAMPSEMQGVLMSLCLIFVLKTVRTVLTDVLLLEFM